MSVGGGLLRSVSGGEKTREGNEGECACRSVEAVKQFLKIKTYILKWTL